MCGADERGGDLLALEVLHALDAAAVAHDQCLGLGDVVQDPEQLDVLALAGCCHDRAGAGFAEMHVAAGHGLDDVAATTEHAPVDLVAGGFFELAGLHHGAQRHQHVLVGKGDFFLGLRKSAATDHQGSGCHTDQLAFVHLHGVLLVYESCNTRGADIWR